MNITEVRSIIYENSEWIKEIQEIIRVIENCKDAYLKIFDKDGTNPQTLQEYKWLSEKWLELHELKAKK